MPVERPRGFEVLERYFPEVKAEVAELTDLPDTVLERLEELAMRYVSFQRYVPGRFHDVQKLTVDEENTLYVARTIKEYLGAGTEESTFVIDVVGDEIAGEGEIRYHLTNDSAYYKDKPFVGFTETDQKFQRGGLGARRLRVMNALAQQKYGKPLHSDTVITEGARRLWEKFVVEGRARMYKEGAHDRFVYEG